MLADADSQRGSRLLAVLESTAALLRELGAPARAEAALAAQADVRRQVEQAGADRHALIRSFAESKRL